MKKIAFFSGSLILVILFSACASFSETYKPLYQVKPETTSLKEK